MKIATFGADYTRKEILKTLKLTRYFHVTLLVKDDQKLSKDIY